MARLCQKPEEVRSGCRSLSVHLEGVRAALRLSDRIGYNQGRLPRLLRSPKGARQSRQHSQNRNRFIVGLPEMALREISDKPLASTYIIAAHQMAYQGRGKNDTSGNRYSAYKAICDAGSGDGRKGWRDTGFNMGQGGLRARHYRLSASRPNQDEQAPYCGADEPERQSRARRSPQSAPVRLCHRVQREAGWIGKEGHAAPIGKDRHIIFCPCIPAHLRGLDGAGRHSNVEDFSISWTRQYAYNRERLCPIFSIIYEGRQPSRNVVTSTMVHAITLGLSAKMAENSVPLEEFESPTPSLRMEYPNAKLPFFSRFAWPFCQFRAIIVALCTCLCTLVHIGLQRDWYSRAALTNNTNGAC